MEEEVENLPPVKDKTQEKVNDAPPVKKTWANVVGNREKGIELDYVAPSEEGVVEFTQEGIDAGVSAWNTAIVGQIVGANPRFKEVLGFVYRAWSKIEIPRVHQLHPGVFLFYFKEALQNKYY